MTRLAVVIGDPIEHSLSPAIHNAAFAELGIDAVYETRRAGVDEVGDVVAAMRAERWLGMSVTMPDKEEVLRHLDRLTPIAERLGAVNCVYWDGDALCGDNTDGAGLVRAVRALVGRDGLDGLSFGVLGAGGAARASIAALAADGAAEIVIVSRTRSRAEAAAALGDGRARVGEVADLGDVDVVINATPAGMSGVGGVGVPFVPGHGRFAMDLVYEPPETTWMTAARDAGATVANGVPMLVGQAAVAFERWTGRPAPVGAMTAGAEAALAARRSH